MWKKDNLTCFLTCNLMPSDDTKRLEFSQYQKSP